MNYIVVGLRVEKYVGQSVSGHNCDFDYTPEIKNRYVLLLKDSSRPWAKKFEVSLSDTEGECGSGWCTASWGHMIVKRVNTFGEKTHTVQEGTMVDIPADLNGIDWDHFNNYDVCLTNDVFTHSYDGGCGYYPSGGVSVNMDLFTRIRDYDLKRPVHVFHGDSDTCKSHLATLTGKTVFETDALDDVSNLPSVLTQDIIVVGNRHKQTDLLDKVIERIFDGENSNIILTTFTVVE